MILKVGTTRSRLLVAPRMGLLPGPAPCSPSLLVTWAPIILGPPPCPPITEEGIRMMTTLEHRPHLSLSEVTTAPSWKNSLASVVCRAVPPLVRTGSAGPHWSLTIRP
uniref:Uncharacterized protein n=1 Tax=Cacopsylla melanoneura TaxID=428564 RepID=A0A8D8RS09_9HEMI